MRRFADVLLVTSLAALSLARRARARAGVRVHIDKSSQRMFVSVDGQPAYLWRVSTGRGGFGTPVGRFRPQWMARRWFSTRYYGSPMPHSIFFHRATRSTAPITSRASAGPASHGCVRLHPANAATLFIWCSRFGMGNTAIVISGGNPRGFAKRRARSAQAY